MRVLDQRRRATTAPTTTRARRRSRRRRRRSELGARAWPRGKRGGDRAAAGRRSARPACGWLRSWRGGGGRPSGTRRISRWRRPRSGSGGGGGVWRRRRRRFGGATGTTCDRRGASAAVRRRSPPGKGPGGVPARHQEAPAAPAWAAAAVSNHMEFPPPQSCPAAARAAAPAPQHFPRSFSLTQQPQTMTRRRRGAAAGVSAAARAVADGQPRPRRWRACGPRYWHPRRRARRRLWLGVALPAWHPGGGAVVLAWCRSWRAGSRPRAACRPCARSRRASWWARERHVTRLTTSGNRQRRPARGASDQAFVPLSALYIARRLRSATALPASDTPRARRIVRRLAALVHRW